MHSNIHPPNRRRQKNAFTLAELLVVIVVLGILGAVAIAIIAGIRKESLDNQAQFNARTLSRFLNNALVAGVPAADLNLSNGNSPAIPVWQATTGIVTPEQNIGFAMDNGSVDDVIDQINAGEVVYTVNFDAAAQIASVSATLTDM